MPKAPTTSDQTATTPNNQTAIVKIEHEGIEYELQCGADGVPRVEDLKLAGWIGLSQPRDIRRVIRTHLPSLGEVRASGAQTSERGGRPSTTYFLTEEQALFVVTRCNTPRALVMTKVMVAVFAKVMRGEPVIAPTPADPLDMLDLMVRVQREQRAKLAQVEQQQTEMARIQASQQAQLAEISEVHRRAVRDTAVSLPQAPELPGITHRTAVNKVVRTYALAMSMEPQHVWRFIYGKLKDHYKVDVYARSQRRGIAKIEIIDQDGLWDQLAAVCREYLSKPLEQMRGAA